MNNKLFFFFFVSNYEHQLLSSNKLLWIMNINLQNEKNRRSTKRVCKQNGITGTGLLVQIWTPQLCVCFGAAFVVSVEMRIFQVFPQINSDDYLASTTLKTPTFSLFTLPLSLSGSGNRKKRTKKKSRFRHHDILKMYS